MCTVYCYAYYFTIKGDQGRQQWTVCYYQGWNFKEHLDTLKAVFLVAPIGLNEECLQFVLSCSGDISKVFPPHMATGIL